MKHFPSVALKYRNRQPPPSSTTFQTGCFSCNKSSVNRYSTPSITIVITCLSVSLKPIFISPSKYPQSYRYGGLRDATDRLQRRQIPGRLSRHHTIPAVMATAPRCQILTRRTVTGEGEPRAGSLKVLCAQYTVSRIFLCRAVGLYLV